jgi:hypothetical protein
VAWQRRTEVVGATAGHSWASSTAAAGRRAWLGASAPDGVEMRRGGQTQSGCCHRFVGKLACFGSAVIQFF